MTFKNTIGKKEYPISISDPNLFFEFLNKAYLAENTKHFHNKDRYYSIEFISVNKESLFGKIVTGKCPYLPPLVDITTGKKRKNEKTGNEIEPTYRYFYFKKSSLNPFECDLFMERLCSTAFVRLINKILRNTKVPTPEDLLYYNDLSPKITLLKINNSFQKSHMEIADIIDVDKFLQLDKAQKIAEIKFQHLHENMDSIDKGFFIGKKSSLVAASRDIIYKPSKSKLLEKDDVKKILKKYLNGEIKVDDLKITIVDENSKTCLLNIDHLQQRMNITPQGHKETGLINEITLEKMISSRIGKT